jgi:spermidine synthase
MAFAALGALLLLAPAAIGDDGALRVNGRSGAVFAGIAAVTLWFVSTVGAVPPLLIGFGRWSAARVNNHGEWLFTGEGMNSSMAVSRLSNGVLNYHNAGKVQASSEPQDMRLQRMLGHLTTLLPPHADSILVIGFGAGVTAGAVSVAPDVKHETIAEIEPLVPKFVGKNFAGPNFGVADNPKVHIQIDDARHFLLTTKQHFDAITSDPFDPWVKGAATLYTEEFFKLAKEHLHDGGVVTVFVQLYESNLDAVKSEVVTFFDAFPDGVVFGNENNGAGYDVVLVGQKNARPIDVDAIDARLRTPEFAPVAQSLAEIGFGSAVDLFGTFAATAKDLAPWLADAQVNRDRNLRLQYLAGLGLNLYEQDNIYKGMIRYRRWPEGLFAGSPETLMRLRMAIGGQQ